MSVPFDEVVQAVASTVELGSRDDAAVLLRAVYSGIDDGLLDEAVDQGVRRIYNERWCASVLRGDSR